MGKASSHGVDQAHLRSVGVREDQGRAKHGKAVGEGKCESNHAKASLLCNNGVRI